ncbi:Mdm32p [Saccharomyces eubayanus]|uniref:Mdm32p n=1 Tax=Saccharomyces eubayanus TaxID=1080349 RepID=UPI0006BFDA78|nr:MDM32-like protein [Saccharomyces eubayanus]KOG96644.1 MDM32-like protein [Saccharomyces eubayanus]
MLATHSQTPIIRRSLLSITSHLVRHHIRAYTVVNHGNFRSLVPPRKSSLPVRCLMAQRFMRSFPTNDKFMAKASNIETILLRKNNEREFKQTLLADARNFQQRFKINLKWILIKNNRPFSLNEISIIVSWLLLSQVLWLILSTTTFISFYLFVMNSAFSQEYIHEKKIYESLLKFLLKGHNRSDGGLQISFSDDKPSTVALSPDWESNSITIKKLNVKDEGLDMDLKFHHINLTVSLKNWLFGKGMISNASIYGIRGTLNLSNFINLINSFQDDRKTENFLKSSNNIEITDSEILLKQSRSSPETPMLKFAIYNLSLPRLRLNHFISDVLSAKTFSGSVNNSLFNLFKRQQKLTAVIENSNKSKMVTSKFDFTNNNHENDEKVTHQDDPNYITTLRLNFINVNDLKFNGSSKFNWLKDGQVEILADIMLTNSTSQLSSESKYAVVDLKVTCKDLKTTFPQEPPMLSTGDSIVSLDELKPLIMYINSYEGMVNPILKDFAENELLKNSIVWSSPNVSINRQRKSYPLTTKVTSNSTKEIIKFHNQPNSDANEIVLRCKMVKNLSDLQLVNINQILDQITMELYVDLTKIVDDWEFRNKNDWMKQWGTTFASQLLLFGFGAMV